MKKNRMFALILVAALLLGLTACGKEEEEREGLRIAVVQQMAHPSLDEIREAVTARLEERSGEIKGGISVEHYNGNGDANQLDQIGAQIVSDDFNAVIPIASLAAQRMINAAEGRGLPVICAAVSDPETTGITGMELVTGTSDALNTELLLDMLLAQNPEVRTVGLLYCPSEDSSEKPIREARAYLKERHLKVEERTGTNASEVVSAAASLAEKADAVFTPTDNTVASAELTIAQMFLEAGIPHYAGADSFVRNGAFATCGVNYTELGRQTADLALKVLIDGEIPPFKTMDGGVITVNTETAAGLGIDYEIFRTMAPILVEVKTTED